MRRFAIGCQYFDTHYTSPLIIPVTRPLDGQAAILIRLAKVACPSKGRKKRGIELDLSFALNMLKRE